MCVSYEGIEDHFIYIYIYTIKKGIIEMLEVECNSLCFPCPGQLINLLYINKCFFICHEQIIQRFYVQKKKNPSLLSWFKSFYEV